MKKRFWDFIDHFPWLPMVIGILAIVISIVNLLITIGFRLAVTS